MQAFRVVKPKRFSGVQPRSDQLASNADREGALRVLRRHRDEGRLDAADYEWRVELARAAKTPAELRPLLTDLPDLEPQLASRADRERTRRALRRHHDEGRLDTADYKARVKLAQAAKTPADLSPLLAGLPNLEPSRLPGSARSQQLASDGERNQAIATLERYRGEGRLDENDFEVRCQLVREAKTPADLRRLFEDLPDLGSSQNWVAPGPLGRSKRLVSDAHRDKAVADLRQHHAEGRLDVDDWHHRTELALVAKTPPNLEALFTDLPELGASRVKLVATGVGHLIVGVCVLAWAVLNGVAVVAWAALGGGWFWPLLVLVPTTVLLVAIKMGVSFAFKVVRRGKPS